MDKSWRSFWFGAIASVVIAVFASLFLGSIEETSGERFSTSSTRLGD